MTRAAKIVWFVALAIFVGWLTHRAFSQTFQRSLPFLAKSYPANYLMGCGVMIDPDSVSGKILWIKGDDLVYSDNGITLATNGQAVYLWGDVTTNANNLIQTTLADRPIYRTNAINGHAAVEFVDQKLDVTFASAVAQPSTYFMVHKIHSTVVAFAWIMSGVGSYYNELYFANPNVEIVLVNNGGGNGAVRTGNPLDTYGLDTLWFDGANSKGWTNGVLDQPVYTVRTTAAVSMRLGERCDLSPNQGCPCTIAEIIIYNGTVSDSDAHGIWCYLKNKYGL